MSAFGQSSADAKKVLDNAAAIVGRRGGAAANFTITGGEVGRASGSIALKGEKFKAVTPETTIWFDGKTQWAYMKSTNEVNISTPNEAQRMSNEPLRFHLNVQEWLPHVDENGQQYIRCSLASHTPSP